MRTGQGDHAGPEEFQGDGHAHRNAVDGRIQADVHRRHRQPVDHDAQPFAFRPANQFRADEREHDDRGDQHAHRTDRNRPQRAERGTRSLPNTPPPSRPFPHDLCATNDSVRRRLATCGVDFVWRDQQRAAGSPQQKTGDHEDRRRHHGACRENPTIPAAHHRRPLRVAANILRPFAETRLADAQDRQIKQEHHGRHVTYRHGSIWNVSKTMNMTPHTLMATIARIWAAAESNLDSAERASFAPAGASGVRPARRMTPITATRWPPPTPRAGTTAMPWAAARARVNRPARTYSSANNRRNTASR